MRFAIFVDQENYNRNHVEYQQNMDTKSKKVIENRSDALFLYKVTKIQSMGYSLYGRMHDSIFPM